MAKEKFNWTVEKRSPTIYPAIKGWNKNIVETAGFIPLEVRFKQMEQAGYRARFFESEFTSKDVSDMYLNHPEFDITPEDDLEEMVEKMELRTAYINQIKEEVKKRSEATDFAKSEDYVKAQSKESAEEKQKTSEEKV